jgi:hypothetical protein
VRRRKIVAGHIQTRHVDGRVTKNSFSTDASPVVAFLNILYTRVHIQYCLYVSHTFTYITISAYRILERLVDEVSPSNKTDSRLGQCGGTLAME